MVYSEDKNTIFFSVAMFRYELQNITTNRDNPYKEK